MGGASVHVDQIRRGERERGGCRERGRPKTPRSCPAFLKAGPVAIGEPRVVMSGGKPGRCTRSEEKTSVMSVREEDGVGRGRAEGKAKKYIYIGRVLPDRGTAAALRFQRHSKRLVVAGRSFPLMMRPRPPRKTEPRGEEEWCVKERECWIVRRGRRA